MKKYSKFGYNNYFTAPKPRSEYSSTEEYVKAVVNNNIDFYTEKVNYFNERDKGKTHGIASPEYITDVAERVWNEYQTQRQAENKSGEYNKIGDTLKNTIRSAKFTDDNELNSRHAFNVIKGSEEWKQLKALGLNPNQDEAFRQLSYRVKTAPKRDENGKVIKDPNRDDVQEFDFKSPKDKKVYRIEITRSHNDNYDEAYDVKVTPVEFAEMKNSPAIQNLIMREQFINSQHIGFDKKLGK